MGFAEALSDDGKLTGRGHPLIRGLAAGIMTAVGGLGHALPYLIPDFWTATMVATIIVFVELWAISWIRYRYMERHSCAPPIRWRSAAFWCSSPASSSAAREARSLELDLTSS